MSQRARVLVAPGISARLCSVPCRQSDAGALLPSPKGPSGAVGFAGATGSVTPARTRQSSEEKEGNEQGGRLGVTHSRHVLFAPFSLCPTVQPHVPPW